MISPGNFHPVIPSVIFPGNFPPESNEESLAWRNLSFSFVLRCLQGQKEITRGTLPKGNHRGKSPGVNHRGSSTRPMRAVRISNRGPYYLRFRLHYTPTRFILNFNNSIM